MSTLQPTSLTLVISAMHTADVEKNMSPVWVRAARIVNASDAFCTTSKISEMYFMRVFGAS